MSQPSILIAGIGNIFLGDDAFGSEVVRQLAQRSWPGNVRVVDFGIRGYDVAYALMEGYDVSILVDATPQGGRPGTIYVIEPELAEQFAAASSESQFDGHTMDPLAVLRLVKTLGGEIKKLLIVGCEPRDFGDDDGRMGLSEPVAAAVPRAIDFIELLVEKFIATGGMVTNASLHVGR